MIGDVGKVIELGPNSCKLSGTVPSGVVLVDGLGVGDVGNIVLRDRKHIAEDGIIVVVVTMSKETGAILSGPDVISRGFVYVRESEDLMEEAKAIARESLERSTNKKQCDWATLKNGLKASLSDYLYTKTKRKPMVLPVIMEV